MRHQKGTKRIQTEEFTQTKDVECKQSNSNALRPTVMQFIWQIIDLRE